MKSNLRVDLLGIAVGILGSGLQMAFPEARSLGWVFILVAAGILAWALVLQDEELNELKTSKTTRTNRSWPIYAAGILGLLGIGWIGSYPSLTIVGWALYGASIATLVAVGALISCPLLNKSTSGLGNLREPPSFEPKSIIAKNFVKLGDNNVLSNVHVGDKIDHAPAPQFRSGRGTISPNPDGSFTTVFEVEVISPYPASELVLQAWASSIKRLDVRSTRVGSHVFGHTGKREGYHFTTVLHPFGRYVIEIQTTKREEIELRHAIS